MRKHKHIKSYILAVVMALSSLFSNFNFITPAQASSILPEGENNTGQHLEIARMGNGYYLDAPTTRVKIAFKQAQAQWAEGVSRYTFRFDMKNGAFFDGQSVDRNAPSCRSRSNPDYEVKYIIEGIKTWRSSELPCDAEWKGLEFQVDNALLFRDYTDTISGEEFFVFNLRAEWERPGGPGGINGFKVRRPEWSRYPGGHVGYPSTKRDKGDRPFAVQNWSKNPDTFTFSFRTPCALTDKTERLEWKDADYQGTPHETQISWTLYKIGKDGGRSVARKQNGSPASQSNSQLGGQDAERDYVFDNFEPGVAYEWAWEDVDYNNGVQFWMPFDGVAKDIECKEDTVDKYECKITATNGRTLPEGVAAEMEVDIKVTNKGETKWTNSPLYRLGGTKKLGGNSTPWDLAQRGEFNVENNPARVDFKPSQFNIGPGESKTVKTAVKVPANFKTGDEIGFEVITRGDSTPDPKGTPCTLKVRSRGDNDRKLFFGANFIKIMTDVLRDNFNTGVDFQTYLWPNAGLRDRGDGANRFWLAGVWGNFKQDNAQSDSAMNADPQVIETYNSAAEKDCPGVPGKCKQRIPLAYVNADDGTGNANEPGKEDGSITPNGNKWYDIREEKMGSATSGEKTSCSSSTTTYNKYCGGIASNLKNDDTGGKTGNYIRNVEVSNIRVALENPEANNENSSWQGGVANKTLQKNVRTGSNPDDLSLVGSQQGPLDAAGKPEEGWDNIRNTIPTDNNACPGSVCDFINKTLDNNGVKNFTESDPSNLSENTYTANMQTYANGTATSYLQDGRDKFTNDGIYTKPTENLTYTAGLLKGILQLRWDEYVDWNQVDDKGHWYTEREQRPIGVDKGDVRRGESATLYRWASVNTGSSEYWYTVTYCASGSVKGANADGTGGTWSCDSYGSYDVWTTQSSQWCTGPTTVGYNQNNLNYYSGSSQTRYGWVTNDAGWSTLDGQPSHFQPRDSNPAWSQATNYWQDTAITPMDVNGYTQIPTTPHLISWRYDRSDVAYRDRYIFSNNNVPFFYTGYYAYGQSCVYTFPNGSASSESYQQPLSDYYPSPSQMYEYTPSAVSPEGQYNVTYDNNKDGVVDYAWTWKENRQRVRYEQAYPNRSRHFGEQTADDIYGLDEDPVLGEFMKPHRALAMIYNPFITSADPQEADIFAGGDIHSYFSNPSTSSAFLFTNKGIENFTGKGQFPGYYNNPSDRSNTTFKKGTLKPHEHVFKSTAINEIKQDKYSKDASILEGTSLNLEVGDTASASAKKDNIFYIVGNTTLGRKGSNFTLTGGAGTIFIDGNLTVEADQVIYSTARPDKRSKLPSVGFIVTGDIIIKPHVTKLEGAYFTDQVFDSRSVVTTGNRTSSDGPFELRGLVIANNFILRRQPSGADIKAGNPAEKFGYDGRVVVNPPMYFTDLFSAPAAWNEGVPYRR